MRKLPFTPTPHVKAGLRKSAISAERIGERHMTRLKKIGNSAERVGERSMTRFLSRRSDDKFRTEFVYDPMFCGGETGIRFEGKFGSSII